MKYIIILFFSLILNAQSQELQKITPIDEDLDEVSAVEQISNDSKFWVIQDSGNDNILYRINGNGNIVNTIEVVNATNDDWEDLTSDENGNIYIGDFGNNSKKRKTFLIYKINNSDLNSEKATSQKIEFKLPKKNKSKDFEAFFLFNNNFYMFSKENNRTVVYKVPNKIGSHTASFEKKIKLKGKHNKVTSADISPNGKRVVLLNHDKIWLLTDYKNDDFFEGSVKKMDLNHDSQKEGVYFKLDDTLILSDEQNDDEGSNLYVFKL